MIDPLVSVVFPVYNDSVEYITKSVESILNQSYQNFELIIADDSTNEETIQILNKYAQNSKIKIHRANYKRNLPTALNEAIEDALGKYIARADADDIQNIDRLAKQVSYLELNENIGIVGSNVIYIDEKESIIKEKKLPETSEKIYRTIHIHNPISHPTTLIRKTFFTSVGTYNIELKRAEDYDLWHRAKQNGWLMYNIQEPLVYYRLSNINKRDIQNWKINLKIKLKYFSLKYLPQSLIGVIFVAVFLCIPKPLKKIIYHKFS